MSAYKHSGKVVTVLGEVDPQSLGNTLMHEHIKWNYSLCCNPAEDQRELWEAPLSLENLTHVRSYGNQNKDNTKLDNVPDMIKELQDFKKYGGATIVELSTKDTGSDPVALKQISQQSGVHIVCATGYYLKKVHPPEVGECTVEQLADEFVSDIETGFGDSGICAGIIGELGCTTHVRPNEIKVLKAAVIAQKKTGASISIHPGLRREDPKEIIDILEAEGAVMSRVVMGHADRGLLKINDLLELAKHECILEFDFFGSNLPFNLDLVDFPSDFERCKMIHKLRDEGFIQQIVISHDISYKSSLKKYGGCSYSHILKNIVPYMLKTGFTKEEIDIILIENPKRILTFP